MIRLLAVLLFTFAPTPGAVYECRAMEGAMWHPSPPEFYAPRIAWQGVGCEVMYDRETGEGYGFTRCGDLPFQACGVCAFQLERPDECAEVTSWKRQ